MESQSFKDYNCDLIELQERIELHFIDKGYLTTNFHKKQVYVTQAYKTELGEKCLIIRIVGDFNNFEVTLGVNNRIDNIDTLPDVLEVIPLETKILVKDPFLANDFWSFLQKDLELNRNTYRTPEQLSPHPAQMVAEREIVREVEVVFCEYCGAKNSAMLTNCSQCGARLR